MIGIVPPVLPSCQLWNCVLRKPTQTLTRTMTPSETQDYVVFAFSEDWNSTIPQPLHQPSSYWGYTPTAY